MRGHRPTELRHLRWRLLELLGEMPMKGTEIEKALIDISNHTAIRRAIRYAAEDGLITREKPSQPWMLAKKS